MATLVTTEQHAETGDAFVSMTDEILLTMGLGDDDAIEVTPSADGFGFTIAKAV